MIENCHWGQSTPNDTHCPWNFYRTSLDIRANYISVLWNLHSTSQWAKKNLSRPGCWAYPDMLEVGCKHGAGGIIDIGLNPAETRTHFGAWCVVSSPLTLSYNITDDKISDDVWPIVSNREAIAINQAWAGHSGSTFSNSAETHELEHPEKGFKFTSWLHEYFYKPLTWDGRKIAVLMVNHDPFFKADLKLTFGSIPGVKCQNCAVRSVWEEKDLGIFDSEYVARDVGQHDSVFLVVSSVE
mmetsp:Transcript_19432/g.29016  ORF Transcript_19432/g.29016 Transcript_19432/m.29016 type:complete len:241 (-) Transcript_19432:67-789(-)